MKTEPKNLHLPVVEVARRLGCSRQHVYNLISSGALRAVRLGHLKGLRVRVGDVESFLGAREV